ncbi:MAG: hypothetical protein AB7I18_03875 [Candidatus Berkiella sp.]
MRVLQIKEQHQASGGYFLHDSDTEFWIYVYGLQPVERDEIIHTKMMMQSVLLFAFLGALGSMAVVELISSSVGVMAGSATFGVLVGGSLGYSFAKSFLTI